MSIFKFIILGIPLLSLAWWMWADRRLRGMRLPCGWRAALGFAMLLLLGSFCWIILARNGVVSAPLPAGLYALVLLWGLIALPLLAIPSMLGWSLWSIGRALRNVRRGVSPTGPADVAANGRNLTRRQVLGTAAVVFPVVAAFGATGICLPRTRRFRIREMTVSLKDLPEALDGMRIAHVTDTHVGKFTRGKMLEEIAEATNRLKADLVLLTGDLIDNSLDDLPAALAMVKRMDPRSGLFMIEGNHDLFDNPGKFVSGVASSGIPLLRNESATAMVRGHPVQLLGIPWNHDEQQMARDVETVAKLRDPSAFPILLAHHPHAFDAAAEHGIPLTLSGHTHGGQLMVTPEIGIGPMMYRYWSGLYQKSGNALVVSNGAGNWFPLRTYAPAEIIHLTLRRA